MESRTRRERMTEELERCDKSIEELARMFECTGRDVVKDMEHIQRSLRPRGKRMLMLQPLCRSCGERIKAAKIKDIKKCPLCKSNYISPARFFIK